MEQTKLTWSDLGNKNKKDQLCILNLQKDLLNQKEIKPVLAHKKLQPKKSCLKVTLSLNNNEEDKSNFNNLNNNNNINNINNLNNNNISNSDLDNNEVRIPIPSINKPSNCDKLFENNENDRNERINNHMSSSITNNYTSSPNIVNSSSIRSASAEVKTNYFSNNNSNNPNIPNFYNNNLYIQPQIQMANPFVNYNDDNLNMNLNNMRPSIKSAGSNSSNNNNNNMPSIINNNYINFYIQTSNQESDRKEVNYSI